MKLPTYGGLEQMIEPCFPIPDWYSPPRFPAPGPNSIYGPWYERPLCTYPLYL